MKQQVQVLLISLALAALSARADTSAKALLNLAQMLLSSNEFLYID